jgi:isocitrate dehydrogenase (NAD+)
MKYGITLIPGDGIGTEVSEAAVRVVGACGLDIDWDRVDAGAGAVERHGTTLPDGVLASIRERRVALKGPLTTPVGKGFVSVNVTLRKRLELYVSLRPVNTLAGVKTPYEDVDVVVFRENTEGLYSGLEHEPVPGVVETLRVSSEHAARRLTRFAYNWCRFEGRRKVHLVHKASDLKMADGQFLDVAHQVASDHPYIETHDILMSRVCMDLAMQPEKFDVLIMENLFGDILSDLCAGLVGGLGVVPGANIGDKYAVFEAVHGSAPDIAGQGVANPIALTRSAALMLKHIGEREAARRIERSIGRLLERGDTLTPDLGGKATTAEVTDAIIREL